MAGRHCLPLAALIAGTLLAWPGPVSPCGPMYYAAAPMLTAFPERHPVKTMLDLFAESQGAEPAPPRPDRDTLVSQCLSLPKAEALAALDQGLIQNRSSDAYEARLANLLWDLRDLRSLVEGDLDDEAKAYVTWRAEQYGREKIGLPPSVAAENRQPDEGWWMTPEQRAAEAARLREQQAAIKAEGEAGERAIAQASPRLAPHWMVARGGAAFRRGALEEAARLFSAVDSRHPDHPRRETALYMLARTRIEVARRISRKQLEKGADRDVDLSNALEEVDHGLEEYARTFPQGRYVAELAGWEGARHSLAGAHWMALASYARQLKLAGHPEVRASAGREIERCLKELLLSEAPDADPEGAEAALAALADSPGAAVRVMGYFLDGPADFGYEARYWDEGLHDPAGLERIKSMLARSRNARLLAFLASRVVRHEEAFRTARWHPKFLALLAWAATEGGEPAQALRLCERDRDLLARSDDLQYCQAVTLQRLGEDARAVQVLMGLRDQFPNSRLSHGLALRLAKCLHRLGRDGEAIGVLNAAITDTEAAGRADRPENEAEPSFLHPLEELCQHLDVLEQFSPTSQLEIALQSPQLPPATAVRLHQVMVGRLLAAEDWESLRRVLANPPAGLEEAGARVYRYSDSDYVRADVSNEYYKPEASSHTGFARAVMGLHETTASLQGPGQKALWYWSLASVWDECRGRLTLPVVLLGAGDYMASDHRQLELRLRANALALGYAPDLVNRELDSRDELQHTLANCLRAADATPGTPLAARALFKALECLRRMAEVSPHAQARAFEADWSGVSHRLYDRLRKECPDSPEASRLAAWWSFAAPPELNGWMPGNGYRAYEDDRLKRHLVQGSNPAGGDQGEERDWNRESERYREFAALRGRVHGLGVVLASSSLEAARQEAAALRQALTPQADQLEWNLAMSALDEAERVLNLPGSDLEKIKVYFLNPNDPARTGALVEDLAAYDKAAGLPDEDRHSGRWWSAREERWQAFLAAHPHSLKREAAHFQLARAIVRQHRTWTHVDNHSWPEAPFVGTYVRLEVEREKPFDAARAHAALDAYEKEFPNGRYRADVRLLRGGVAVDAGDFPMALRLLETTIADDTHKELHLDAALALAQCFERLHDPETRLPLARAIMADPAAWKRFQVFTHSPSCGQRLRVYEGWMTELKE